MAERMGLVCHGLGRTVWHAYVEHLHRDRLHVDRQRDGQNCCTVQTHLGDVAF